MFFVVDKLLVRPECRRERIACHGLVVDHPRCWHVHGEIALDVILKVIPPSPSELLHIQLFGLSLPAQASQNAGRPPYRAELLCRQGVRMRPPLLG